MTATLFKTLLVSYLFFLICLVSVFGYSLLFFSIPCLYLFCFSCYFVFVLFCLFYYFFFIYSVFPVTLSFLLLCLSSYFVFMSFCLFSFCLSFFLPLCHSVYSLLFCLFSCFCRTSSPPIFLFILASFLLFHLFIFWYFCLNI